MSKRLMLGGYWKARRESIEQCASRLTIFMRRIQECDEVFSHWYHKGRSRKDALKRKIYTENPDEIFKLLDKGRHRNFYKEVIENLGFSNSIWNGGEPGKESSLSFGCGLYSEVPGLSNSIVLHFPDDLGELADPIRTSRVLSLAATCWEPDWAGIVSEEAKTARDWWRQPFVDWMVYVPRRIESVPQPSSVMHLENGGSIVIVQPVPPSVDNPEDQNRIRKIEEIIQQQ